MSDAPARRSDSFSVRSLERGLDILRLLNRHNGLTVTETAEQVSLPRPTAFRLLRTLERLGYIFRDDADKKYRLTAQVRSLSHGYDQEEWLPKIARPIMVELCKKILWPVTISTNMGSQMLV
ncbi:MAG: helix-turn-helix domain-containing protein, partial [Rhodospirillaceae bacterium]|nr:helix-turn-helix domain-containing protein [Rhodospirillaceae bacterium]